MTSDDEEDKNNKEGTTMTSQDDANNKDMTADMTLNRIIRNAKVECFKDMDDAFPFIENTKGRRGIGYESSNLYLINIVYTSVALTLTVPYWCNSPDDYLMANNLCCRE
jgi:hypothetical protein